MCFDTANPLVRIYIQEAAAPAPTLPSGWSGLVLMATYGAGRDAKPRPQGLPRLRGGSLPRAQVRPAHAPQPPLPAPLRPPRSAAARAEAPPLRPSARRARRRSPRGRRGPGRSAAGWRRPLVLGSPSLRRPPWQRAAPRAGGLSMSNLGDNDSSAAPIQSTGGLNGARHKGHWQMTRAPLPKGRKERRNLSKAQRPAGPTPGLFDRWGDLQQRLWGPSSHVPFPEMHFITIIRPIFWATC